MTVWAVATTPLLIEDLVDPSLIALSIVELPLKVLMLRSKRYLQILSLPGNEAV